MIALYVVAILIVGGAIVAYFVLKAKKRRKKIEQSKFEDREQTQVVKTDIKNDLENAEKEVVEEEKQIEAELEDFHFGEDEKKPEKEQPYYNFEGDNFDEDLYRRKMDSYDNFLQEEERNSILDDELSESDRNDINDLMEFDFDSLKGKTRAEVEVMVKDFSPAVRDFILNDIFDKKQDED